MVRSSIVCVVVVLHNGGGRGGWRPGWRWVEVAVGGGGKGVKLMGGLYGV
jgi:hypothetical protein